MKIMKRKVVMMIKLFEKYLNNKKYIGYFIQKFQMI